MRNILLSIFILFCINVSAQNVGRINADLNLSDSLMMNSEIRIYTGGGITNYSSLFRMYRNKSNNWIAELYEHYSKVEGQDELKIKKHALKCENDMEFVWYSILRTNIEFLPNMSKIKYKLRKRGEVELVDEEYQLMSETKHIMDGIGYKVQIITNKTFNEVNYTNPESYIKYYPEVDELIYFNELLSLIKNEFNIWQN